jgi:hypothetical protein
MLDNVSIGKYDGYNPSLTRRNEGYWKNEGDVGYFSPGLHDDGMFYQAGSVLLLNSWTLAS